MANGTGNGRNVKRAVGTSIGLLAVNFLVAILDQYGVELQPNVVATGTLFGAASINILVSKYFS